MTLPQHSGDEPRDLAAGDGMRRGRRVPDGSHFPGVARAFAGARLAGLVESVPVELAVPAHLV